MSDEKKRSRIRVEALSKDEQELTTEEAKKVQGGLVLPANSNSTPSSAAAGDAESTESGVANLFSKI